jgi:AcrR family transcriptional regulator
VLEPGGMARSTADSILDAAIDLFIESGFETVSMDAIALRTGVAKGTLYYHFKSKEGIVEAIVERFAAGAEAALGVIVGDPALNPLEKMKALIDKQTELYGASFSKLHKMKYIDIHLRTQRAMVDRLSPFHARIVEEGIAAGIWKTGYPLEFCRITMAASSILFDPGCYGPASERLVTAMIELTARGLGVKPEALEWAYSALRR